MCDYCGNPWLRSELWRDSAGLLRCKLEGDGPTAEDLDRSQQGYAAARLASEAESSAAPSDGAYRMIESGPTLEDLGDALLYWDEAPDDTAGMTLVGDRVDSVTDMGAARANRTAPSSTQRPVYNASGGPNDKPYFSAYDATSQLNKAGFSIASAAEVAFFAVCKVPDGSYPIDTEHTSGEPGFYVFNSAHVPTINARPVTGGNQTKAASGADDWHLYSVVYRTDSVHGYCDGAPLASDFSGSGGMYGPASRAYWFFAAAAEIAHESAVDLSADAEERLAYCARYFRDRYGLGR
jgi:hypothetical protein